jgi:hypothetical protein
MPPDKKPKDVGSWEDETCETCLYCNSCKCIYYPHPININCDIALYVIDNKGLKTLKYNSACSFYKIKNKS